jgi:hypothetical protein
MERNIYKIGKELFITSDEDINQQTEPCWCINTIKNTWDADLIYYQGSMPQYHYVGFKKIILTDNTDLIADGVQPIDDEFLEWLVNNPACEFVKVDLIPVNTFGSEVTVNGYGFDKFIYKITIPQEEPKPETLEQVAEKWYSPFGFYPDPKQGFIAGAEWQAERMYSESEVIILLNKFGSKVYGDYTRNKTMEDFCDKWFKQNKKK